MQPLEARFLPFRGLGRFMATSKLSRLECRVKPLRENNTSLLALYDAFFTSSEIELFDLTADVIEMATDLRASLNFKTPDSLHLATAIVYGATSFVTGDKDLSRCSEISVEIL